MSLRVVNGRAYPLGRANVDTDMVISSEWLKTITREGLGKGAFAALRRDPANVFDDPMYIGAPILIAGDNFGCGSSREHAAWAIADLGISVVIAPSFSDIFSSNAFKNGILTVTLPTPTINRLLVDAVGGEIDVDLQAQEVRAASGTYRFEIDPFRRRCLLEGLDEIALTLGDADDIRVFETSTTMAAPWLAKARSAA